MSVMPGTSQVPPSFDLSNNDAYVLGSLQGGGTGYVTKNIPKSPAQAGLTYDLFGVPQFDSSGDNSFFDVVYGQDNQVYFPNDPNRDSVSWEDYRNRFLTPEQIATNAGLATQAAGGAPGADAGPADPWTVPNNPADIAAWLNSFTPGGPESSIAQYAIDYNSGSGQFADMSFNPETMQWEDPPGQATEQASVLPGPADNAGGQDSDVLSAFEDYIKTAETASADAAKLAQTNQDNLVSMFQDQIAASTAQNQQMMTMMMGLMNPRREDEQRGSFTYNALGGR